MPAPAFAGVNSSGHFKYVIAAKAAIHEAIIWIPAFAGMTVRGNYN